MKCPYRKITTYSKVLTTSDITIKHQINLEIIPCSKNEAFYITEEFADCISFNCPCYVMSSCSRVKE